MLEFLLSSLVTIMPDYLFRRYAQGKRWGVELNLFSMWYELRWGLTSCFMLTVSLITVIFYYHPSTNNVSSFFRTVTILPETPGRVAEVYVVNQQMVKAGDKLFALDSAVLDAAAETARRQILEVDAASEVAQSELEAAAGAVAQAEAAYKQTEEELERKLPLFERGSSAVSERDVDRLKNQLALRQGEVDAAMANKKAVDAKIGTQLPAQKATAEAALQEAETALSKTVVYASVDGTVHQFALQPGDYVNPILRPAGILIPEEFDGTRFQAGFGQISAQVIKPGMLAEISCVSLPFTVVPMVVVDVQEVIAAGQFRPSDRLIDIQDRAAPGTLTVALEPLYPGQTDAIPPGSKCVANAYTSYEDALATEDLSTGRFLFYHMVDTVALVHAMILRIQTLVLPVQTLVFGDH